MEANNTVHRSTELQLPSHIPQLDGVRGIAILAVMLVHSADRLNSLGVRSIFRYGWVGVDLFFVLSGFLITRILLQARESDRFFRNFYVRRALRVWPLYYSIVVLTFALAPSVVSHYGLQASQATDCRGALVYVLFLQNLWHSSIPLNPMLGVTWSLAIEEQFYVVWPALVFALSGRALGWALGGVLVISPVVRAIALGQGVPGIALYVHTLSRLDGIAIGCLLAVCIHSRLLTRDQLKWSSLAALAIGGVTACALVPASIAQPANPLAFSALAIAFCGFLGLALTSSSEVGWFGRMLTSRPLRYLGMISYCVYLIHLPIFLLVGRGFKRFLGALQETFVGDSLFIIVAFGATCSLAAASWYFFEQPILQLKSKFASSASRRQTASVYCPSGASPQIAP
jgi:peptidoglycan/LPS O-acetylase OafA/YrhL